MFKKYLLSLAILWLISVAICCYIFRNFSHEEKKEYHRLLNANYEEKETEKSSTYPSQQQRYGVSKQIFYNKDSQRRQTRLTSQYSELIYDPKKEGKEIIEQFEGLACTIQEKILDNAITNNNQNNSSDNQFKQYIRYLEANEAMYCYKTGQMEAENVKIAHFLVPGLVWPQKLNAVSPLLQGNAQKLQISISKEINLQAQEFQVTFYDWGEEW